MVRVQRTQKRLWIGAVLTLLGGCVGAQPPAESARQGVVLLPEGALFLHPVGGLEATQATAETTETTGQPFSKALRVVLRQEANDSNATQLTIPIARPVRKDEALFASFALRGARTQGAGSAQAMFLFERSSDPWTKSIMRTVSAPKDGKTWRRFNLVFASSEDYQAGQAMVSLRFAFGRQTLEVADLRVVNLGKKSVEEIQALSAELDPLGTVTVTLNAQDRRQKMVGFGGNFCQARYGSKEMLDAVGRYTLANLQVKHSRIGLPLNDWNPEPGVFREEGTPRAALLLMQEMRRRNIPIIISIWEGPGWMLGGERERTGRVLPRERYAACIEAIARFLALAREKYNAPADYVSFNEADYGVNFKFSPAEITAFMLQAAPRFRAAGLTTKWLVGDTANGGNLAGYARPLLENPALAPLLGPIAFHSWDVLGANEAQYRAIAELGKQHNKPVWCTEAGHDAQLWQQPNPWNSWENALRLTAAYARTITLSGASLFHYWTYQDNYPLVSSDGAKPFPALRAIQSFERTFPPGAQILGVESDQEGVYVAAALGADGKSVTAIARIWRDEARSSGRGCPHAAPRP